MTKVLLATDGSPHARAAAVEVCSRTWQPDCKFEVLSVAGVRLNLEQARNVADQAADLLRTKFGSAAVEVKVVQGQPADTVVQTAKELHANYVVVGAYGLTALGRMIMGSVTDAVANKAKCNVIVARERKSGHAGDANTGRKILVCIDRPETAHVIIEHIRKHQWSAADRFNVINIFSPPLADYSANPNTDMSVYKQREQKAQLKAEEAVRNAASAIREQTKNPVETLVLEEDEAGKAIIRVCQEWEIDLVIVGPREHKGMDEMLLGSVQKAVLLGAPCSVELARD